jgi:hypothetical protein
MELEICGGKFEGEKCFFIAGDNYDEKNDKAIAKKLNMSHEEYTVILLSHGGFLRAVEKIVNCDFRKLEDAESALKALEPYLIMHLLADEV